MPISSPLDHFPLWGLFAIGSVLLAVEGGYRFGRSRRLRSEDEMEAPINAIFAATLGLLGFILAFTFGVASRYDACRLMVAEEANAIGTTYLRAGLLPNNCGLKIRNFLAKYVHARLEVAQTGNKELALLRSDELHRQLWKEAEAIGLEHPNSIVVGLFVQALIVTLDVHSKRVLIGVQNRLPDVLWVIPHLVTAMTMAGVGYHEGISKSRRSLAIWGWYSFFPPLSRWPTISTAPSQDFCR